MHFLFILLLCTQSTLATTTSSHLSDKSIRTPAGTRYTVEAIDPTNTAETEAQLKSLHGDNNVIIDSHGDESASWTITSDGDDLTGTIEALESVRMVQPKDAPQIGTGEGHRRLSRQNNGIYTVFAKKPNGNTDTKATEESLRSKIQPGTHIYITLATKTRISQLGGVCVWIPTQRWRSKIMRAWGKCQTILEQITQECCRRVMRSNLCWPAQLLESSPRDVPKPLIALQYSLQFSSWSCCQDTQCQVHL